MRLLDFFLSTPMGGRFKRRSVDLHQGGRVPVPKTQDSGRFELPPLDGEREDRKRGDGV